MNKAKMEEMIIEAAREIPSTYGEYKLLDCLYRKIARIMGYEISTFYYGWNFRKFEDREKARKIISAMEKKGIIKKSKSGMAYKMI